MFFKGYESKNDFWVAWNLQFQHHYGGQMPPKCPDVRMLWYTDTCSLGPQLRRLYEQVPKAQTHLIQLEQVKANPWIEYRRLLDFLNVKDKIRTSFPISNTARRRRFKAFRTGCHLIYRGFHATTGYYLARPGFIKILDQYTRKPVNTQSAINASLSAELVDYFNDETRLAEQVTGLNLDYWPG